MMKKTIFVSVVGFALVCLIGYGTIASIIGTAGNDIRDGIGNMMPIEFELKRAKQLLKDLTPEIRDNMVTLARAEIKVREMDEKIGNAQERLAKSESHILRLTTDLESLDVKFIYASRSYTRDQVKTDLASRFQRHTVSEVTLTSWQKQRDARNASLAAARRKFAATIDARRSLEVEVELLEAKWMAIKADVAGSQYAIDDSRLGKVKELVRSLNNRIKVEENLIAVEGDAMGEIPLDDSEAVLESDIVADVRSHFNSSGSTSTAQIIPVSITKD